MLIGHTYRPSALMVSHSR